MGVQVVDERKEPLRESYVVRLGGWTLERYLREAPEDQIWEFVRGEVVMHSPASAEHQISSYSWQDFWRVTVKPRAGERS